MTQTVITAVKEPESAMEHVKALAFDRSTSSNGETEALMYIKNHLTSVNIESDVQYFSYDSPFNLLIRIAYIILLLYVVIYRLFLVLVIYIAIKYMSERTRKYSLVKKDDSKNLLAKIYANNKVKKRPVIIVSAHYDSFSASVPYRIQNVLFFVFRVIIVPYFASVLTFSIIMISKPTLTTTDEMILSNLVIVSSIINFTIIILVFLLIFNTKKSQGSIDNASGVAVVIELTKRLKENALNNYDVIALFTGAEEWGLIGSKRYYLRNEKDLKRKYNLDKSFNINIDMVGTYIGLIEKKSLFRSKPMNRTINPTIQATAQKLDIPITIHRRMHNPKTDHRNFLKFAKRTKSDFQVACFHSDKDSKYIHSARDSPDKCSSEILNNATSLIFNTIQEIDRKY